MDLTLRSDWWARIQVAGACAAMALMAAVVFGLL